MVLLLIVVIFFFFHLPKVREDDALNISSLNKEEEPLPPKFDHHLLEKGALALSSEIQNFPFPDLSGEVIFLAKNTRPDATLYEIKLHIGLKGSEKTLRVSPGQTVYLTYDQERLNFSKEITPLWIKPCLDESGELWLQMGIHLKDAQGGKVLQEMREFQIKQNWKTKKIKEAVDPQLKTAGDTLKNGKWWAPDKLFEKYGGQEFLQYNGCERLELLLDKGRQILFLNEGETFIWKEGEWIPSVETKGFPMGKVISVTPYKVEWQLWDRGGMESVTLTFNKEKSSVISMRIEDVFTGCAGGRHHAFRAELIIMPRY